jgi:cell division protein FtsZ
MIPRKKFFIAPAAHAALWDSIQGSKSLTPVVGLGEKTGPQFARMIARSGHEVGTFVWMVATMPFPFQGKPRLHRAEEGLREQGLNMNGSVISNNDFAMDPVDKELNFLIFRKWFEKPTKSWPR